MITKEDIKTGVKLKLLCSRGRVLKGKGIRSAGTVITIKSVDTVNSEFEDTDGTVYWICDLQDFDLVPSVLPTDRPLTCDETQMLQAGDVVRYNDSPNHQIVTSVTKKQINDTSDFPWILDADNKSTAGNIYFVSRPEKAEVKEEKKDEVKGGFRSVTFNGIRIHSGNLQKEYLYGCDVAQESISESMKKHIEEHRKFLLRSTKSTKSVSQILYGR